MILAQPAGFQRYAARLILAIIRMSDKNFPQTSQAFRKIREDFSGDFTLVAAGP